MKDIASMEAGTRIDSVEGRISAIHKRFVGTTQQSGLQYSFQNVHLTDGEGAVVVAVWANRKHLEDGWNDRKILIECQKANNGQLYGIETILNDYQGKQSIRLKISDRAAVTDAGKVDTSNQTQSKAPQPASVAQTEGATNYNFMLLKAANALVMCKRCVEGYIAPMLDQDGMLLDRDDKRQMMALLWYILKDKGMIAEMPHKLPDPKPGNMSAEHVQQISLPALEEINRLLLPLLKAEAVKLQGDDPLAERPADPAQDAKKETDAPPDDDSDIPF